MIIQLLFVLPTDRQEKRKSDMRVLMMDAETGEKKEEKERILNLS